MGPPFFGVDEHFWETRKYITSIQTCVWLRKKLWVHNVFFSFIMGNQPPGKSILIQLHVGLSPFPVIVGSYMERVSPTKQMMQCCLWSLLPWRRVNPKSCAQKPTYTFSHLEDATWRVEKKTDEFKFSQKKVWKNSLGNNFLITFQHWILTNFHICHLPECRGARLSAQGGAKFLFP